MDQRQVETQRQVQQAQAQQGGDVDLDATPGRTAGPLGHLDGRGVEKEGEEGLEEPHFLVREEGESGKGGEAG